MDEIYQRLRQRLDDLGPGFPATESGIEIKILKRLFTEKEAELFPKLSPLLEASEEAANRLGLDVKETAALMEQMARRGLLFRQRKDGEPRYAAVPFVVGIFEFQLNRLDPEFARDFDEYFQGVYNKTLQSFNTPVLRTIPINRDLVARWPVAPYEDVMKILEDQKVLAVAPCICRTMEKLNGRGCDKPVEACFVFGSHAHYYVENNMARYITLEEGKEIVRKNQEAGLVMQPFNSQKVGGMCSCCGDCCGMLRSLRRHPHPAKAVQSNFFAEVDEDRCIGCETCLDRCQIEAIRMIDGKANIDLDRCIGCGLCVTTCPEEALRLVRKPEEALYAPPMSGAETYMQIAMERGKSLLPTG